MSSRYASGPAQGFRAGPALSSRSLVATACLSGSSYRFHFLLAAKAAALARAGFETDSLTTAADAWAALRALSYAAVVLDLGLPDQDGLALLKTIR